MFASTDDWDNHLENIERGWPDYFEILRLYLTHFRGQPCSMFQLMGMAPEPASAAWETLARSLNLSNAKVGEQRQSPPGNAETRRPGRKDRGGGSPAPAPPPHRRAGTWVGPSVRHDHGRHGLPLDPGLPVMAEQASAVKAREEPSWNAWINNLFPPPVPRTLALIPISEKRVATMAKKNQVVHFEIPAAQPEALSRFYSDLFDWTFQKIPVPGLEFWHCDGTRSESSPGSTPPWSSGRTPNSLR